MGEQFVTSRGDFEPSSTTRSVLAWARAAGASTIGDALEMLDVLENSNDIPRCSARVATSTTSVTSSRPAPSWSATTAY
jgi:hypothetical protein